MPNGESAVIIIGGGVAGDSCLRGYIGELQERGIPLPTDVAIVEPRSRLGVGQPWDLPAGDDILSTNMPASTLKTYGGIGRDGALELGVARPLLPRPRGRPQTYAPRSKVGTLLQQRAEELHAHAYGGGMKVEHVKARAEDVRWQDGRWVVALGDGRRLVTGCVVLSLGLIAIDRFPHLRGDGYHADGWNPGDLIDRIDAGDRVAIIGAGPTAIDWAIALKRAKLRHPVMMCSRSGRLPAARPPISTPPVDPQFSRQAITEMLERHGPLDPAGLELFLRGIMAEARATPSDVVRHCALAKRGGRALLNATLGTSGRVQRFFNALKAIDDLASALWRASSPKTRAYIAAELTDLYARLSFAVPPHNAQAILAQLGEGMLRIAPGLTGIERRGDGFQLNLPDGPIMADIVINATGFDGDLSRGTNPLVHAMLKNGLLAPDEFGGVRMGYDTGEVRDFSDAQIDGLFVAGGSLSRGAAYLVNALVDTSEHGIAVGRACARHFIQKRGDAVLAPATSRALPDVPPDDQVAMRWVA